MKKVRIWLIFLLLPVFVFAIVLAQPGDEQPVTVPLEVLRYDDTLPDECQVQVYATHTMPIHSTFYVDIEYRLDGETVFTHTAINPFYICLDRNCPNTYEGIIVYTPTIVGGGVYDEWRRGRWTVASKNELWIRTGFDEYGNDVFTKTGQMYIERTLCGYGQQDARGFYRVGDFVVGKLYLPIIFNSAD